MKIEDIKDMELIEELESLRIRQFPGYEYTGLDEDFRYLDKVIPDELKTTGKVNMTGHTINSVSDLASLFKIFRDRRYETFRLIYLKNNKIVGTDNVTSKLPGASTIMFHNTGDRKEDNIRTKVDISNKVKRLNADGIYIFHNHPSGDATPSWEDFKVLVWYCHHFPELILGSIILGNGEFSLTKPESLSSLTNSLHKPDYEIYDLDNFEDEEDLGEFRNSRSLVKAIEYYSFSDDVSLIVFANSKLKIMATMEVDNYEFNHRGVASYIHKLATSNGSPNVFLVTKDIDLFSNMNLFTDMGVFDDVICIADNDILSLATMGKLPINKFKQVLKSYKV